jgi:hypothetical protein
VARAALGKSLVSQARFQRATGRIGQRFETLDLLRQAAASVQPTDASDSRLAELRAEAAAVLALPDLRLIARWPVSVQHYDTEIDFTRDLDRYVTAGPDGGLTIFATVDRHAVRHFPGAANNPAIQFRFSPDGRWLAATFQDGGDPFPPVEHAAAAVAGERHGADARGILAGQSRGGGVGLRSGGRVARAGGRSAARVVSRSKPTGRDGV